MVSPTWFPYINKKQQSSPVLHTSTTDPAINENFNATAVPDTLKENSDEDNDSDHSDLSADTLRNQRELRKRKKKMISVNTTEFNDLILSHVSFIYRILFKYAFKRHQQLKKDGFKTKNSAPNSCPALFPIQSIRHRVFPETIQCMNSDRMIDLNDTVLTYLQALCNGTNTDYFCLILACFELKEPEFATEDINFLITNFQSFPADSLLFEPETRLNQKQESESTSECQQRQFLHSSHRKNNYEDITNVCASPPVPIQLPYLLPELPLPPRTRSHQPLPCARSSSHSLLSYPIHSHLRTNDKCNHYPRSSHSTILFCPLTGHILQRPLLSVSLEE